MMQDGDIGVAHSDVLDWIQDVVARDGFTVEKADLAASRNWRLHDGGITHRSGRFFRIVGLRHGLLQQPYIEQREVGILAFIVRHTRRGPEILIHAKVEPGNVNVAQVAPSVQATASNLDQVHGGLRPWGASFVCDTATPRLSDTLESEQGTRFVGKFNRNISLFGDIEPPDDAPLRWVETATLLRLLDRDFAVNTDARSVLAAMPWDVLAPAGPFASTRHEFGEVLRHSFVQPVRATYLNAIDDRLIAARRSGDEPTIIGLHDLRDWSVQSDGTVSSPVSSLRVLHIRVSSLSREVSAWDQPVLETRTTGLADLCGCRINGSMHFGFSMCNEPGLVRRVELGPTTMASCDLDRPDASAHGRVVMTCRQSDEGGRFFRDITLYRVVDHGDGSPDPTKMWLGLSEIRALLDRGGYFTNEARTLISLLMRHLVH